MRIDGRNGSELRKIDITPDFTIFAEGSVLYKMGNTQVLCNISVEDKVPQFQQGTGRGWITSEYALLPRSTKERSKRESGGGRASGRSQEIQRLIGRSLRSVCNLTHMEGLTLWLDCDVLVADGGTRTAAITGSYIAAALALRECDAKKLLKGPVLREPLAAISCGLTEQGAILDMDYAEDSQTLADANFVMTASGLWVEVQVTAEQRPLHDEEIGAMKSYAAQGIRQLIDLQQQVLQLSR